MDIKPIDAYKSVFGGSVVLSQFSHEFVPPTHSPIKSLLKRLSKSNKDTNTKVKESYLVLTKSKLIYFDYIPDRIDIATLDSLECSREIPLSIITKVALVTQNNEFDHLSVSNNEKLSEGVTFTIDIDVKSFYAKVPSQSIAERWVEVILQHQHEYLNHYLYKSMPQQVDRQLLIDSFCSENMHHDAEDNFCEPLTSQDIFVILELDKLLIGDSTIMSMSSEIFFDKLLLYKIEEQLSLVRLAASAFTMWTNLEACDNVDDNKLNLVTYWVINALKREALHRKQRRRDRTDESVYLVFIETILMNIFSASGVTSQLLSSSLTIAVTKSADNNSYLTKSQIDDDDFLPLRSCSLLMRLIHAFKPKLPKLFWILIDALQSLTLGTNYAFNRTDDIFDNIRTLPSKGPFIPIDCIFDSADESLYFELFSTILTNILSKSISDPIASGSFHNVAILNSNHNYSINSYLTSFDSKCDDTNNIYKLITCSTPYIVLIAQVIGTVRSDSSMTSSNILDYFQGSSNEVYNKAIKLKNYLIELSHRFEDSHKSQLIASMISQYKHDITKLSLQDLSWLSSRCKIQLEDFVINEDIKNKLENISSLLNWILKLSVYSHDEIPMALRANKSIEFLIDINDEKNKNEVLHIVEMLRNFYYNNPRRFLDTSQEYFALSPKANRDNVDRTLFQNLASL